jgi:hypothetical protein
VNFTQIQLFYLLNYSDLKPVGVEGDSGSVGGGSVGGGDGAGMPPENTPTLEISAPMSTLFLPALMHGLPAWRPKSARVFMLPEEFTKRGLLFKEPTPGLPPPYNSPDFCHAVKDVYVAGAWY